MYGDSRIFLIAVMLFVYTMSCMLCVVCVRTSMRLITDRFDAWMERLEKREEEFFCHKKYAEPEPTGKTAGE